MKPLYYSIVSILLVAALALSAVPREGRANTAEYAGEESILFYEVPSIYAASKHEQKVTEAPSSVSIITADEIQKYGYRTLDEALRSVRGIYTTYDRNYTYLGVRGFARPGDYNTRMLVLIDGVRINDSVYDTGAIGTEFPLDMDIIDRIEIIRGPSSSLYGTNAFFGIINIVTKRGRDLQGLEVSAPVGSYETYRGRVSYGNRLASGLEIFLSGSVYDSKGIERLYYEEFDDPETNYGITENTDTDDFFSYFGKVSFRDFTLEGGHVDRNKRIPTASYETVFNDERTYTEDVQTFISLKYDHTFANRQNVVARLSYDRYHYYGVYVYDYSEGHQPWIVLNEDYATGKWMAGELQYSLGMFEKHNIILGAEYRNNFQQEQGCYDVEVYLDDEHDSQYWSLFLNEEYKVIDQVILNAGVRYDHFDSFGGTTNPRIAAILNPIEKTVVKLLYGRAFRAPNAYELYYEDAGYTWKPNPDLEPEVIRTYEVILEQHIGDRLFGTVNGFVYNIDNLITMVTDPEDEMIVFRNVAEIEARGVEVGLEGRLERGIEGRVSYAYVETEDKETEDILSNSPQHLAKVNMIVPVVSEKLFSAAEVQYTSERMTVVGGSVDGFFIMNLNLFLQLYQNRVRLSAGVYNVFDEAYMDPAGEEHAQEAILQNGRTFQLKVALTF